MTLVPAKEHGTCLVRERVKLQKWEEKRRTDSKQLMSLVSVAKGTDPEVLHHSEKRAPLKIQRSTTET